MRVTRDTLGIVEITMLHYSEGSLRSWENFNRFASIPLHNPQDSLRLYKLQNEPRHSDRYTL
ncbi:hypothetical protein SISNIDRAFT_452382 [Sistotremastrum niveocremeum HHB9708]|uniref:Uncharacterized protein n=2 Tax=Sistotremastraceae TaxID=3402574 RepID=A0A164WI96_9AGAM|nr:hypothetical protein SISNIDRAFT_452382 [Sistotremastrum niveocremeum HHB9708]KZT34129.1 hypothetical protein SISSUDRAFT_1053286 [Sistotremastrum suecicum HHB10207 ss-3]